MTKTPDQKALSLLEKFESEQEKQNHYGSHHQAFLLPLQGLAAEDANVFAKYAERLTRALTSLMTDGNTEERRLFYCLSYLIKEPEILKRFRGEEFVNAFAAIGVHLEDNESADHWVGAARLLSQDLMGARSLRLCKDFKPALEKCRKHVCQSYKEYCRELDVNLCDWRLRKWMFLFVAKAPADNKLAKLWREEYVPFRVTTKFL